MKLFGSFVEKKVFMNVQLVITNWYKYSIEPAHSAHGLCSRIMFCECILYNVYVVCTYEIDLFIIKLK